VHRLLPADITRRLLSLGAALAAPAALTAALALAAPAQASPLHQTQASQPDQASQDGRVSIAIDSISPTTAKPGSTVTVTGTVSNGTSQTRTGLDVQLLTSSERFGAREAMDTYASQGADASLVPAGNSFSLPASLRPGAIVQWHASFQVNAVGMTQFGVYPVTAQLVDAQGVVGQNQTLLPFWPGQQAAGLARPLDIAWVWPLIDQPHHQVCTALTSNDLAASLAPGGRLSTLLGAGQAYPGAHLTWVIDPALLSDVATMTKTYQVASGSGCSGAVTEPASKAAKTWLSALGQVTSTQPTVITPYANVDLSALVHSGLTADITSAYTMGYGVADDVLHGSFGPSIAVPAGGTADLSVLTNLATAQHIGAVVLNSNEMPPVNQTGFVPDNAVTSVRTGGGQTMTVLLADNILTGVLADGDTSSGALPPSTPFEVSQRFLAETAMIAAEAPSLDRSIVVEPPEDWSPSAALARDLLSETTGTPWLASSALSSLAGAAGSGHAIARQPLPASKDSPGELSASYLSTVSAAGIQLGVYTDLLYQPSAAYVQGLEQAQIATESSAWRGGAAVQGLKLSGKLARFMSGEESKIKIIAAQQVPMGGSSGPVPVSIQNGSRHAIRVRLKARVVEVPGRTSQLTVGRFPNLITVQPQQAPTVRLPVSSAPIGPTAIRLSLTTANGKALPLPATSLTVQSTRYGRAILFLIGAAIGILVLTSVFRGVRRWLHDDTQVAPEDAGLPGSVVTGTSSARHPTEAPDDLADARRRADDP
jgi:Family of unknown function (DUF6049)